MSNPTRVACPVPLCGGQPDDHRYEEPAQNLHTQPGRRWPTDTSVSWPPDVEIPVEVDITMDQSTWPHWHLNVEIIRTPQDLTALQVGLVAAELNLNAMYVAELNRAADRP